MTRILAFDLETVSPDPARPWLTLEPWRRPHERPLVSLSGVGYGPDPDSDVGQTWWPEPHEGLHRVWLQHVLDKGGLIVGWNLIYDWAVVMSDEPQAEGVLLELGRRGQLLDLMYLAKRVDMMRGARLHQTGYSLGEWLDRYGIDHPTKATTDYHSVRPDERDEALAQYHRFDLAGTWALAGRLLDEARPEDVYGATLESAADPLWAASWLDGMRTDEALLESRCDETAAAVDAALERIRAHWPDVTHAALRSSAQVADQIFDGDDALTPVRTTATGKPGTDGKSLRILAGHSDQAEAIADYKRAYTRMTRFLLKIPAALDYTGTGRMHPQPRPASTYTGRATYTSTVKIRVPGAKGLKNATVPTAPPVHQIERSAVVRDLFLPHEGFPLLAEFDFSGQEMRIMADRSGDERMIAAWREGKDLHAMTAAALFHRDYDEFVQALHSGCAETKKQRMAGKVTNLASQYRIGWRKFQFAAAADHGMHLSDHEAKAYLQGYKAAWPGVVRYWDRAVARARALKYAETVGGRRVALDFPLDPRATYADEQTAINFPIQGSGGDLKAVALFTLVPWVQSGEARMLLEMHDGVFFSVKDEGVAREMLRALNEIDWSSMIGWEPSVPMVVDGKTGPSWGQLKEMGNE